VGPNVEAVGGGKDSGVFICRWLFFYKWWMAAVVTSVVVLLTNETELSGWSIRVVWLVRNMREGGRGAPSVNVFLSLFQILLHKNWGERKTGREKWCNDGNSAKCSLTVAVTTMVGMVVTGGGGGGGFYLKKPQRPTMGAMGGGKGGRG
jgi:hypothetical protein